MNEKITTNESHYCRHFYKRISWSAILIGALVALGLGFLLNLFGVAIGLSALSTDAGQTSIAIGGFLGLLIGTIATMFVAGYTAGYLGRLYSPRQNIGVVYGFGTWTLALVLAALVSTPFANYLASYSNLTAVVAAEGQQVIGGETTGETAQTTPQNQFQNMNISPSMVTWISFMAFLLFFIGALSCCFGAYWGMSREIGDYNYTS